MLPDDYTDDLEVLGGWVGRTEERIERLSADWFNTLGLTLDHPTSLAAGDRLPPLWHFVSFHPAAASSELDRDGHPRRGDFLPPVRLPRRMWAGGRFRFARPILLGDEVTKRSRIEKIDRKDGRSGTLIFVTVHHEFLVDGEVCIDEEQDLVYRDDPAPDAPRPEPRPAPTDAAFERGVTPSEVLLFRYSALTFNSHRIHYDREYARAVEGYPNLVVHGPLTATLLAGLARDEGGRALDSFSFRGMAPLFDDAPFTIAGRKTDDGMRLWAATPEGGLAMEASATFVS